MSTEQERVRDEASTFAAKLCGWTGWRSTPQGYQFWCIVHRELMRIASGYYDEQDPWGVPRFREFNPDKYSEDGDNTLTGWDYPLRSLKDDVC